MGLGKNKELSNTEITQHMSFKKYDFSKPLKEWVLDNFLPPVFKLDMFNNPETLADLEGYNLGAHSLILWSKQETPSAFRSAAEFDFDTKMHFMIYDEKSQFSLDYSKKHGADMDKNDYQIVLVENKTLNTHSFDGDATNESEIIEFVQAFLSGNLKKQPKSQPIPNPSHEENVKILVGKTHDREVYSGTEHFVMYYAPWCGHCKNFKPDLEKFAAHVKDTNIVVAKIDMTENELTGTTIKGYPTIYWYPKDPKADRIKFED
jgi:thiol-disulfide isomerase/thioredoxin